MEQWLRVIRESLSRSELAALADEQFGDMVKGVVDVECAIMAIGIEFDSMINVRPSQGNRSRTVEDSHMQARIRAVVAALVTE